MTRYLSMCKYADSTLRRVAYLSSVLLCAFSASFSYAQDSLPVFRIAAITNADPSVWAIQYMKEKGIDRKNGFELDYQLKPVPVAYSEFINGTDPVCMCLTIGTAARFVLKGADVSLLSTYNNYPAAYLVTENKEINKPQDIIGHSLAGSTGSGSWIFQQYFLKEHQAIDLSKVTIPSVESSAQIANLVAGRVDAITVFDDTRLKLEESQPGRFKFLPTFDKEKWSQLTGVDYIPMFLLGARGKWLEDESNIQALKRFNKAYAESLAELRADPAAAAKLLGKRRIFASENFMISFLNELHSASQVVPAEQLRQAISVLSRDVLPNSGLLERPLSDEELDSLIAAPLPD